MVTDYVSAELVKLFNNIARYVHFAVANQFALVADTFGANIYEIRRLANHEYPRSHIAMPGLTAGTCLRKDFGMINEWSPYPDMLLAAWKMNEFIPAFLVQHLGKRPSARVPLPFSVIRSRWTRMIRGTVWYPNLYDTLNENCREVRLSDQFARSHR